jgi:uncharacterized protein (TIGR02266 family)
MYQKFNARQDINRRPKDAPKNSCNIHLRLVSTGSGLFRNHFHPEAIMQNKRQHERVQKQVKSQVENESMITFSSTQDMSSGGLFISTPDPVSPGSEVNLSIKLPDGEYLTVRGIVRWTKDEGTGETRAGMGIEFVDLSEEDSAKIKQHF